MEKTIDVNKTISEINTLSRKIKSYEEMLTEKKQIMRKYFDSAEENSISDENITVYVQERTTVDYDIPKLQKKLGKEVTDQFIDKIYKVNDWHAFTGFLKSHNISGGMIKEFIDIEKQVNKEKLSKLYESNEITVEDLKGCYTAKTTKTVALRLKDASKDSDDSLKK